MYVPFTECTLPIEMVGQVAPRAPGVAAGALPGRRPHAGHAQDQLPVGHPETDFRAVAGEAPVAAGVPPHRDAGQPGGAGASLHSLQHDRAGAQPLPVQVRSLGVITGFRNKLC